MSAHLTPSPEREIHEARTRVDILRDLLADQGRALDEARLRMLIAETPLADRDLQAASGRHAALELRLAQEEARLAALEAEGGRKPVPPRLP